MVGLPSSRGSEGSFQGLSLVGMRSSPPPPFKWMHRLKKLIYDEVRCFTTHIRCYLEIMRIEQIIERMFVAQFLDGLMVTITKGYPVDLHGGDILDRLIKHVRPLNTSLHSRLFSLK